VFTLLLVQFFSDLNTVLMKVVYVTVDEDFDIVFNRCHGKCYE